MGGGGGGGGGEHPLGETLLIYTHSCLKPGQRMAPEINTHLQFEALRVLAVARLPRFARGDGVRCPAYGGQGRVLGEGPNVFLIGHGNTNRQGRGEDKDCLLDTSKCIKAVPRVAVPRVYRAVPRVYRVKCVRTY